MKKWISLIGILSLSSMYAQKVSDYQYIIVPEHFDDFVNNQYQLQTRLSYYLSQKNYTILSNQSQNWPAEVQNNPCLATTANLKKQKSMLNNKLELSFTNCQNQTIETFETTSKIKEFDKGYQDALRLALNQISNQNQNSAQLSKLVQPEIKEQAKINTENVKETSIPEIKQTEVKQVEESNENFSDTNNNVYTLNNERYVLETIVENTFILTKEKDAQIVARINPTTQNGVYKVTVIDPKGDYTTIGYLNNNELSIEYQENGKLKLVKFQKVK